MTGSSLSLASVLPYLSVIFQVGIMLCALLIMRSIVLNPKHKKIFDVPDAEKDFSDIHDIPPEIEVFTVDGSFALGALFRFDSVSGEFPSAITKVRILRFRGVSILDPSDLLRLRHFKEICEKKRIVLIFSDMNSEFVKILEDSWLADMQRNEMMFLDFATALKRARAFL